MRVCERLIVLLLALVGRVADAEVAAPQKTLEDAGSPLQFIDWALNHRILVSATLTLGLLLWAVAPPAIARVLAPGSGSRTDRERIADRYRGLITKIIAVPLVMIPLLAYIDGYLKARADERKERVQEARRNTREATARELEARARFEERYRESAQLLDSTQPISQLMGLEGLRRLLEEDGGNEPKRAGPILEGLARSAQLLSPRKGCGDMVERLPPIAESLLTIVAKDRGVDLPLALGAACLRGASVPYARLNHADLSGVDLSGADLYHARLFEANLRFANLSGTNLAGADLSHAGLLCTTVEVSRNLAVPELMTPEPVPAQLAGTTLHGTRIEHSLMTGAVLSGVVSFDATIKDTCMTYANLHDARFHDSRFEVVDLSGINGSGAWFNPHAKDGREVKGTESRLRDVSFEGADLTAAEFRGATLERVSFVGADLSWADFEGATISDSELQRAFLCNTKMPSGRVEAGSCRTHERPKRVSTPTSCRLVRAFCDQLAASSADDRGRR